jgi:hypothetical protein
MAETDTVATSTIGVQRGAWSDPELVDMVAPPVIVSSIPVERAPGAWRQGQLARSRGNMPVERHRRPNR